MTFTTTYKIYDYLSLQILGLMKLCLIVIYVVNQEKKTCYVDLIDYCSDLITVEEENFLVHIPVTAVNIVSTIYLHAMIQNVVICSLKHCIMLK